MRFLVVEDDFGSRKLMQKLLSAYGDCDIVVDGEEAVESFSSAWEENNPYDVIFMDIMLPKMNGQKALQAIRELEKNYGVNEKDGVKTIMTTAMEDPKNVIEAYNKGGAIAYITKPINIDKLKEELAKIGI